MEDQQLYHHFVQLCHPEIMPKLQAIERKVQLIEMSVDWQAWFEDFRMHVNEFVISVSWAPAYEVYKGTLKAYGMYYPPINKGYVDLSNRDNRGRVLLNEDYRNSMCIVSTLIHELGHVFMIAEFPHTRNSMPVTEHEFCADMFASHIAQLWKVPHDMFLFHATRAGMYSLVYGEEKQEKMKPYVYGAVNRFKKECSGFVNV